jgi:hypothetical protein
LTGWGFIGVNSWFRAVLLLAYGRMGQVGMMEGWEVGRYREIAALRPKIPTFHYSIFKASVKIISIS